MCFILWSHSRNCKYLQYSDFPFPKKAQSLVIKTVSNYSCLSNYKGIKVKVKLPLCLNKHHTMTYWGIGGIAPHILDLSTRWRWVVSFIRWLLYPQGKSPWYPLDRRLGRPQSQSGHGGKEKILSPFHEMNPHRPACSLVAIPTELSQLHLSNYKYVI
jgi:hypothetical protein